jgi:hypothetical protein
MITLFHRNGFMAGACSTWLRFPRLHRRAHQVTERQERAQNNENSHADGEQNPGEFNSLGAEMKDTHCSSARQLRLQPAVQRDIAIERRPLGAKWWADLRLIFVLHWDRPVQVSAQPSHIQTETAKNPNPIPAITRKYRSTISIVGNP